MLSWLGLWVCLGVWGAPRKISHPAAMNYRYADTFVVEMLVICVVPIIRAVCDKSVISRCCCCGVPSAVVSTLAGSTAAGSANGVGTSALFRFPTAMAWDRFGNVIVADCHNNLIRIIGPTGIAA